MNPNYPITDKEYLKERLQAQQKYHSEKASSLKKKFIKLNITIMILSALIPIITLIMDFFPTIAKIIIALLGGASSVITGYLSLANIGNTFVEYRLTSERLKALDFLYRTQVPPFDDNNAYKKWLKNVKAYYTTAMTNGLIL